MTEFLEKSNGLDPFQNAYRRGYSTQTALVRVMDDIRYAADRREVTVSVFFDFSKAFDCVNHRQLINKLFNKNFSNSTLRWLYSYLDHRMQSVRDPTTMSLSDELLVETGVPQGSVLGPLLFTLYVSDFSQVLKHSKHSYYADDLLIYIHCAPNSIKDAISRINYDITNIVKWATSNGLALNSKKTSAVIFGSAKYINGLDLDNSVNIIVDNNVIPFKDSVVYLGVTITSKLSWEKHVTTTISRVNMTLYRLKLNKQLIPLSLRIRLISGLICPILDYCCSVFSDLTAELDLRLQRVFNAGIRFIFGVRKDKHITPSFTRLQWLKIKARRQYYMCCFLFNIIWSERPTLLYNEFIFRRDESSRCT